MSPTDSAYGGRVEAARLRAIHEAATRPVHRDCCGAGCQDCIATDGRPCSACFADCPCIERRADPL